MRGDWVYPRFCSRRQGCLGSKGLWQTPIPKDQAGQRGMWMAICTGPWSPVRWWLSRHRGSLGTLKPVTHSRPAVWAWEPELALRWLRHSPTQPPQ